MRKVPSPAKSGMARPSQSEDPIRNYLLEIGKYPLLTYEEETELARTLAKGRSPGASKREKERAEEAKTALINSNLRLVVSIAKARYNPTIGLLDLVQEGNIALIEAIRQQAPQTKLFVESILPIDETDGRWKTLAGRTDDIPFANMLIKAYCETHGITYVDIFHRMTRGRSNQLRAELSGDGLHLTEQGYRIWAFELKKYINRL